MKKIVIALGGNALGNTNDEQLKQVKNVNEITISLIGTGFLRYMVRNIVGLLIEI